MLIPVISALGWLVAHLPEPLLRLFAAAFGDLMLWLLPARRRLMLSNLQHAFPERAPAWRRRMARQASQRLVETALLSLATPHLSDARIRRIASLAPSVAAWSRDRAERPRPVVFGTLHLALWESQTWLKLLAPAPLPEFGIIFRPLDSPAADRYVKRARERFGMRLLSRREGFAEALRILRAQGCIGVLFDQNAGLQGSLSLVLGRVCSSTELPGLLTEKFSAELRTFYPRRTGFWRVSFESDPIGHDGTAAGATLALNRWLEGALARDDQLCASWLWAHNRWRHQDIPEKRFRLESRRNLLAEDLAARGLTELPRRLRIWIRLPNWLGDVVMALPLLRALRLSRPDAEITLHCRGAFVPLLERFGCADRIVPLPAKGFGYVLRWWRRRHGYPDVWVAFTNSWRGDLEGFLAGAPQRFGIARPGRGRPLLTHAFTPPSELLSPKRHQCELEEAYFRHFGLNAPVLHTPFTDLGRAADPASTALNRGAGLAPVTADPREHPAGPVPRKANVEGLTPAHPASEPPDAIGLTPSGPVSRPIGLIAGSENRPAKRWPVEHWRALIAALPEEHFWLLGTPGDQPITAAIAAGLDASRVTDLAGQTGLVEFAERLSSCRLVVTNDTGGMHLANALGIPVVALFGPTNPLRTGPVFAAPRALLQPAGCPPEGGAVLSALPVESVLTALRAVADSLPSN